MMYLLILLCLLLLVVDRCNPSPITNPLAENGDVGKVIPDYFDTKRGKEYHNRSPNGNISVNEISDSGATNCLLDFKLRWSANVGSPVFASPIIFPSSIDESKQIFLNTYYETVELLNSDGFKSFGWPISFEDSSFQSSPVLYDIDGDSNVDVGVVDKKGNLFWIRVGESGEYLEDYHIQVPGLKVKRDWAVGLNER